MKMKRIFIVDDDSEFRRFLKKFLARKPGLKVSGDVASARQALEKVEELDPDLVLMDIRLPGMNGFSASRLLKQKMPDLQIIIMTIFDNPKYKESAVENGAFGYVVKSNLGRDLMPAIRAALKNKNRLPDLKNN